MKKIVGILVVCLVGVAAGYIVWSYVLNDEGTLIVKVTDEPIDEFDKVFVTFSEIKVQKSGENAGWYTVSLQTKTVDLLGLHKKNATEVLGIDKLKAGKYTQIWIVVESAKGVKTSGEEITFIVPDGTLKIITPFEVKKGESTTLIIDFDLARCVSTMSIGYIFTPVAGMTVEE